MKQPLRILPPPKQGFVCQAAIPSRKPRLKRQHIFLPLPKWRYCAWDGEGEADGLNLCKRHRCLADANGVVRLL